jgi:hypothetical protein
MLQYIVFNVAAHVFFDVAVHVFSMLQYMFLQCCSTCFSLLQYIFFRRCSTCAFPSTTPSLSAQPSVTSYVSSHGFCSVLLKTFENEKLSNMKCILYADI